MQPVTHTQRVRAAAPLHQTLVVQQRVVDPITIALQLEQVVLHNRTDSDEDATGNLVDLSERLSNFRVSIYDGDVEVFSGDYYTAGGYVPPAGLTVELGQVVVGDRVRVQLLEVNNEGNGVLSLAEVEVFGLLPWEQTTKITASDGSVPAGTRSV